MLFDQDLADNNSKDDYKKSVETSIADYKNRSFKIRQTNVCDSDDVKYLTDDSNGDKLAYVTASYFTEENKKFDKTYQMYVLRKDDNGDWKIRTFYKIKGNSTDRAAALAVIAYVPGLSGQGDAPLTESQAAGWEMFDAGIAAQTFCLADHLKRLKEISSGAAYLYKAVILPKMQGKEVRILKRLRHVREEAAKLLFALEIEFLRLKFHAVWVVDGL